MISTVFFHNEETKFVENISVLMKEGCKIRLRTTFIFCTVMYLFGQGNFIFTREKSGNFKKKSYGCGNHEMHF